MKKLLTGTALGALVVVGLGAGIVPANAATENSPQIENFQVTPTDTKEWVAGVPLSITANITGVQEQAPADPDDGPPQFVDASSGFLLSTDSFADLRCYDTWAEFYAQTQGDDEESYVGVTWIYHDQAIDGNTVTLTPWADWEGNLQAGAGNYVAFMYVAPEGEGDPTVFECQDVTVKYVTETTIAPVAEAVVSSADGTVQFEVNVEQFSFDMDELLGSESGGIDLAAAGTAGTFAQNGGQTNQLVSFGAATGQVQILVNGQPFNTPYTLAGGKVTVPVTGFNAATSVVTAEFIENDYSAPSYASHNVAVGQEDSSLADTGAESSSVFVGAALALLGVGAASLVLVRNRLRATK